MNYITMDQLKEAVKKYNIKRFELRKCSICNAPLNYMISIEDDEVAYDSNCYCSSFHTPPEPRKWSDLLNVFNTQTPKIRAQMWNRFINVK